MSTTSVSFLPSILPSKPLQSSKGLAPPPRGPLLGSPNQPLSFSATRLGDSEGKMSRSPFGTTRRTDTSYRRLFDGVGRSNQESDQLVKSGNDLYTGNEFDEALTRFTAAIAEKDKGKANDLSHAQAYLGAAAIFEHKGKTEMSLHHYQIGIRMLQRVRLKISLEPQNIELLAASYVRAALLLEGKGASSFPNAIEMLKKALEIYQSSELFKSHLASVHEQLRKIYLNQGQERVASYHLKFLVEASSPPSKLFQRGSSFLSDFLELDGMHKREASSSPSSVATEPSPARLVPDTSPHCTVLPPIDRKDGATSPPRTLVDSVGVQHTQQTHEVASSPIRRGASTVATSPPRTLVDSVEAQHTQQTHEVASSPIRQGASTVGTSPPRTLVHSVEAQHTQQTHEVASSPIRQGASTVATSPYRTLVDSVGVQNTQHTHEVASSPIRQGASTVATSPPRTLVHSVEAQHTQQTHEVASSPIRQGASTVATSSPPTLVHSVGVQRVQEFHNMETSPIRTNSPARPILSEVVKYLIKQLETYDSDKMEKMVAAKKLFGMMNNYSEGKTPLPEVLKYLNEELKKRDNPIFAGFCTHKLKDLFSALLEHLPRD